MYSKNFMKNRFSKQFSLLAMISLLVVSCGKSSEGDVFKTTNGTRTVTGTGTTTAQSSGNSAFEQAKSRHLCNGSNTAGRVQDVVIQNVQGQVSSGYNNAYPYGGGGYYGQPQQQGGQVGVGVSQSNDVIMVQSNGNGTMTVTISYCSYSQQDQYYGMVEVIGNNSGFYPNFAYFQGSITSSSCGAGGFQGSVAHRSQATDYYWNGQTINNNFYPVQNCN